MYIVQLQKTIHDIAKDKGFWDKERNVGELLMLCVSELGEALEAHRKDRFADKDQHYRNLQGVDSTVFRRAEKESFELEIKDTFEDEIADTVIRLLDLAEGLDIDLEWHINEKMKYNKTREKLHGKKY